MNILYFLIAVLVIAIMIFIHELGHYTVGRLLGFKILDFSIGFGPALAKVVSKKTGITYALRAIPLGGACRFYGEEDEIKEDAVAFNSQKPWKRLLVIFAGPFMNFLLAYVLAFLMMLCFGNSRILTYENGENAIVITELTEGGAAEKAGVKKEDVIIAVNGANVLYTGPSFDEKTNVISNEIQSASGDGLTLTVMRDGEIMDFFIADIYDNTLERNVVGITMGLEQVYDRYGFFDSFKEAGAFLVKIVSLTFESIANGFRNGFKDGEVSGIVGTVAITMKMASMGFYYVLFVMILISMSLGIMNLLPILPMDGHLLFDFIELVVGKPVPRKIQAVLSVIGIVLLLALMVYATIGDIRGIVNGLFS